MKKRDNLRKEKLKKIWKSRAVSTIVLVVSAFLCAMTLLECTALWQEWDIPVLGKITGGADSFLFEEYREVEAALDNSTENVLLESANVSGSSQKLQENTTLGAEIPEQTDTQEVQPDTQEIETASEETEEVLDTEQETLEFPYYIKVNRQQNCITVYAADENGEYTIPYKAIICSTGLYNATPTGTFHLSDKYIWRELYGGVYGQYASRVTGGVLFHSVPYARKEKDTLYADKYNKLGQQASMGCIRLTVADAKWITENCPSGTTVEVYDDEDPGPLGKPEAAKIDTDSPNKGWDPTDPDEENPWHFTSEDN